MKTTTLIITCIVILAACKKKEPEFRWSCKSYTTVSWSNSPIDSNTMMLPSSTEEQAREQEKVATYKKSVWNEETGEHDFAQVTTTCTKK